MRAAVVREPGGPEVLQIGDLPDPVRVPGAVVVAVEAAGVNPVDVGNRADATWADLTPPYVVGYEFAGRVLESGEDGPAVGDTVWGLLPVRGTQWGTYAERIVVPETLVSSIPATLDPVEAAALPLAGGTAWQVLRRLSLPPDSWLVVIGAGGGVGHLLVQLALHEGVRVAVICGARDRARLLGLGAELWVDRGTDSLGAVHRLLGHDVNAVVDLVGGHSESAQAVVRDGGALASVVDLSGDFELAVDRNLSLHGVLVTPSRALLTGLADAVHGGLRPHVVEHGSLDRAPEMHARLERGGVGGKLVLLP